MRAKGVEAGLVEIHSHGDGQATSIEQWPLKLAPRPFPADHGQGGPHRFAPTGPSRQDWAIGRIEGVEENRGTGSADPSCRYGPKAGS
jgi:hypothetical protein